MTTLVMCAILFFGALAFIKLPVSDMPSVDYPTIEVTVEYPGAQPETMANTVTSILERSLTGAKGLQLMFSSSSLGYTTIVLQFDLNVSIDGAAQDVQEAISRALGDLPEDLPRSPSFQKINPTQSPVLYLALTTQGLSRAELYHYAYYSVLQQLSMVEGVSTVDIYGSDKAVRVQMDPDKLWAYNLSFSSIFQSIKNHNSELGLGTLYGPNHSYSIKMKGQLTDAQEYKNVVVRQNDGNFLRLGDLGDVIDSLDNDKFSQHYLTDKETASCVILGIQKERGANTLNVIANTKKHLAAIKEGLPKSIFIKTLFDETPFIEESVSDVEFTLLVAFLLVALVVFFYLGKVIDTIIPVIALPLSIVGTFSIMYLVGYSVDILSLLAITLSVGYLIDDAIVVLENINRWVEKGETPFMAALKGSKEIAFTIVAMTLSLATIFIPLIFMPGIIGRVFREFAVTIFTAVIFSGFISLTLTPMLCSRFIKGHDPNNKTWAEKLSEKINERLLSLYKKGLKPVLNHPYKTLCGGIVCVALTAYLGVTLPKDFLPTDDLGFIIAFVESADNTSPYKMMEYQKEVSDIIKADPNVESLVAVTSYPTDYQGICFIKLKPRKKRASMEKIITSFYKKMHDLINVNIFFKSIPLIELQVGTGMSKGDYQYTLQSLDQNLINEYTPKLKREIEKIPGITQVSTDLHIAQSQVHFDILHDKAAMFNLDNHIIEQTLSYAYSEGKATTVNQSSERYDVILESVPSAQSNPDVLNKIYVPSQDNNQNLIPLSAVTSRRYTSGPSEINHFNTLPASTLTFNIEGAALSTALGRLKETAKVVLPPGITSSVEGTAQVFEKSFASLGILVLVAFFSIYIILGILYENFIHPITIMTTLPPAILGGLATLLIAGETLSLYAYVGIIMLLGIVLKNGIIMVNFAEQKLQEGHSAFDAIQEAALTRFRPIIMTTFAAMMGAVPIALGIGGLTAQTRRPLGYVIVGGLIVSQMLTIYLTPVIFLLFERLKERLTNADDTPPKQSPQEK